MQDIKVRDIMIPKDDMPTISADSTLFDAVMALEQACEKGKETGCLYDVVLVAENGRVSGCVSQVEALLALDAGYASKVGAMDWTSRHGFTSEFIKGLIHDDSLWQKPLADLCQKAAIIDVGDLVRLPGDNDSVNADETLDAAVRLLAADARASVLVTENNEIVGVIHLSDVFHRVSAQMASCPSNG